MNRVHNILQRAYKHIGGFYRCEWCDEYVYLLKMNHLESVRTLLLEHYLNGSWESLVLVHYVKHVIIINLLQANVDTCR